MHSFMKKSKANYASFILRYRILNKKLYRLMPIKMENPVVSPVDGTVTEIFVEEGAVVQSGDVLVVVK